MRIRNSRDGEVARWRGGDAVLPGDAEQISQGWLNSIPVATGRGAGCLLCVSQNHTVWDDDPLGAEYDVVLMAIE